MNATCRPDRDAALDGRNAPQNDPLIQQNDHVYGPISIRRNIPYMVTAPLSC